MSLQASWNKMVGTAAVFGRLTKLQKSLEKKENPKVDPKTDTPSVSNSVLTRAPVRDRMEAADRAQEHIQEADTAPNSGAEFRRRLLQRLTEPKNDEDDIINPSLLEGGNT